MKTALDPRSAALFEVPVPPEHFGQDGGKFYYYYDALAEEIDENMVTGLKEQLDGHLIFVCPVLSASQRPGHGRGACKAGLFAGINTAFLVLTLPLMSPDPADDTNALLKQNNAILLDLALGRNQSLTGIITLPSETFTFPIHIFWANVLFTVSLIFALLSSFMAVLGRQWLVHYRKRRGDGPDSQRWEQLKRFLGAERWGLERVLEVYPPLLLQIGIIIFLISLMFYLGSTHPFAMIFSCAPLFGSLVLLTGISPQAVQDKFCPYQRPLVHLIHSAANVLRLCLFLLLVVVIALPVSIVLWASQLLVRTARTLHYCCIHGLPTVDPPWKGVEFKLYGLERIDRLRHDPLDLGSSDAIEEEDEGTLYIIAIGRTICTSNDAQAQAYAVSNILAIQDGNLLGRLAAQCDFANRISSLSESSYNRTLQLCGRDRSNLAAETSWLYRAAITHIQLSTSDSNCGDWFRRGYTDGVTPFLSPDMIQHAPQNLVSAWLGYMADSRSGYPSSARHLALGSIIVEAVNPSWRCISMVIVVIMVEWGVEEGSHEVLHSAYTGKPSIALQNLRSLLKKTNDYDCQDQDTLKQYLVKIFRLTGKAAANNSRSSSSRPEGAASILRFSEDLIRAHDSGSDLVNIGRNLREELTSALLLEYEAPAEKMEYSTFKETLEELHDLFAGLTARLKLPAATVGQWCMTSSNKEDVGLVSSFTPVLRKLNVLANTLDDWGGFKRDEDNEEFKQQVAKLNELFASFKTEVQMVSRQIKMWKRDPDLGWCDYDQECGPPTRL